MFNGLPIAYLNGAFLAADDAQLHVSDLSILRGYGVFDYFRYREGRPIFLQDHLDRFYRSAALLDLRVPISKEELAGVVHELIARNEIASGGIRFVLTGGYSENGYTPAAPNLIALAYPFTAPPARMYEDGAKIHLHPYERQLPTAKTIDYVEGIRLQKTLAEIGADYALYVDRQGYVRESDRSNFLIVKDGTLITPEKDLLLGITRHHILKLAEELGIPTAVRQVSTKDLLWADEAIICSSTKGPMPIATVDGAEVGRRVPGVVTERLVEAWPAYSGR